MPRLIDADKLSEWIADQFCEDMPKHWDRTAEAILRHINEMPTVDPVKHGYWKIIQEYYMECSVCKTRIDKRDLEWAMDVDADYCPHCGAKMDEEVEDEDQT